MGGVLVYGGVAVNMGGVATDWGGDALYDSLKPTQLNSSRD